MEFHLWIYEVEFRGGISDLKRDILSSHVSKTGKPQVEFRYEISDRNSPRQNFTMEFRLEFYGKISI